MANYPTSLPSATPADHAEVLGELRAIATELGVGASGPSGSLYTTVGDALAASLRNVPFDYASGDYWLLTREIGCGVSFVSPSSNAANSNNQVTYVPFSVRGPVTTDRLSVYCSTANAGASAVVRQGIYASTAGRPGAVVMDAGTASINATGLKTCVGASTALAPGDYFYALAAQGLDTAGVNPVFACVGAVTAAAPTTSPPASNNMFPYFVSLGISGAFANTPTVTTLYVGATPVQFHGWMKVS